MQLATVTAVILAGGFGTRIKHLLGDLPKPMAPAAGKPFLEWVVRYLARQGIKNVIISTGYGADIVEKFFRTQPVKNVSVVCIPETSPLGTAGGFLNAAKLSGQNPEAWLVLNGDSLVFADLRMAVENINAGTDGVIIGREVPDASRYGTLSLDSSGNLLRFDEKRPGAAVINSGVYIFRHALLPEFPKQMPLSMEKDAFPHLLSVGKKMKVVLTDAPFLDIGTPESLPEADRFIAGNQHHFEV